MRNRILCVLLSALFTAALSAPALGQYEDQLANLSPTTTVYADALLARAVTVADTYWARVTAPPICPAELFVYDERDGSSVARGSTPGCRVYFDRAYRNSVWDTFTDRNQARVDRVYAVAHACALAAHERGHNYGLDHSDTGIMRPDGSTIPTECSDWARSIVPVRANRDKRGRRP